MHQPLPLYKCHKEVRALKIKDAYKNDRDEVRLIFGEGWEAIMLDADASKRFMKCTQEEYKDKGYYVVYEDGYQSWSPTKAFEEGYALVN